MELNLMKNIWIEVFEFNPVGVRNTCQIYIP
jgi:hypothetical protein